MQSKHYCADCDMHFRADIDQHAETYHDGYLFRGIKDGNKQDYERRNRHKL